MFFKYLPKTPRKIDGNNLFRDLRVFAISFSAGLIISD